MMGASGGFPFDLLLFAMIAAFLVLRLRSILGRRTGFERPPADPAAPPAGVARAAPGPAPDAQAEVAAPARPLPSPSGPVGQTLARMAQVDAGFDPQHFLAGAEAAFRMIVAAYAAGERETLRPLLSDDTYRGFEAAITAREAAGERQRTELKAINQVSIEDAALRGTVAAITVRFVSDQVNETLDKDGRPVAGIDGVTEIQDLWTFERDLAQPDPAWRLVAAQTG